jgi:hypothetical protein
MAKQKGKVKSRRKSEMDATINGDGGMMSRTSTSTTTHTGGVKPVVGNTSSAMQSNPAQQTVAVGQGVANPNGGNNLPNAQAGVQQEAANLNQRFLQLRGEISMWLESHTRFIKMSNALKLGERFNTLQQSEGSLSQQEFTYELERINSLWGNIFEIERSHQRFLDPLIQRFQDMLNERRGLGMDSLDERQNPVYPAEISSEIQRLNEIVAKRQTLQDTLAAGVIKAGEFVLKREAART